MNQLKTILLFICLQFAYINVNAQVGKYEVRAVWLTTIGGLDWPHSYAQSSQNIEKQKRELTDILDKLQYAGINTVLLQTRVRGTVIYPSKIEPWDGCLSGFPGRSPGYDALQFAIDECHKRGMELQAWVVTIPVGKWNGMGCKELRKKMPQAIRRIGADGYMNPESPQTATYLRDICQEIVDNYDVDGIHLDYIRYPETWNIQGNRDKARDHITAIVRSIHAAVKREKPWVKMSCSPVGKADDLTRYWSHGWNAYSKVCQDATGWLQTGLMDEVFPMMYFQGNQFYPFAFDWQEQAQGKIIVPGLGIYFMSPAEKNWPIEVITRQMKVLRNRHMGYAFFRSEFFAYNLKGLYDFTAEEFNRHPALIPPMTWISTEQPDTPKQVSRQGNSLSWEKQTDTYYNIYASDTWPIDMNKGENLLAARMRQSHIEIAGEKKFYAITAMNRYGNESDPAFMNPPSKNHSYKKQLECNGQQVFIAEDTELADADMTAITNIQGELIDTRPVRAGRVNVTQLSDGCYFLRTLHKNGQSHRIGFFVINR